MYPPRMSVRELCEVWNLTETRIYQFIHGGKLRKGPDGKVDTQEAFAFRASQLDANQARALFQTYGNGSGPIDRKIAAHLAQEEPDYVDADDFLSDEPSPPRTHKQVLSAAVERQTRLTELRAKEKEVQLQRLMRREAVEDGKLIERKEVYRAAQHAAAEVKVMLGTLEHEIAALFQDHDVRSEVRSKVGNLTDRCLYAFAKKFEALAHGEDDEDEV